MKKLTNKKWTVLPALLLLISSAGCLSGPEWNEEVSFPTIAEAVGKKAIVTNFTETIRRTSVTHSQDLIITEESHSAHDISAQIASRMQAAGIKAEARVNYKPEYLREDEVLVRGAVRSVLYGGDFSRKILMGLTLMIVGGILPSPTPFNPGANQIYRVEVIGPDGRILLQTGNKDIEARYCHFWIGDYPDAPAAESAMLLANKIGTALGEALGGNRQRP